MLIDGIGYPTWSRCRTSSSLVTTSLTSFQDGSCVSKGTLGKGASSTLGQLPRGTSLSGSLCVLWRCWISFWVLSLLPEHSSLRSVRVNLKGSLTNWDLFLALDFLPVRKRSAFLSLFSLPLRSSLNCWRPILSQRRCQLKNAKCFYNLIGTTNK